MSYTFSHHKKTWFTLIEMMIVISIVIVLFSVSIFPYSYYMQRAYVERTIDSIGQEWVIAHKDVRNGKMFDTNKHANLILVFEKWREWIRQYLLSGTTIPTMGELVSPSSNSNLREISPVIFDSNIQILSFSWSNQHFLNDRILAYIIEAPYGRWQFFTGSQLFSSTGIFLTIWYTGSTLESGRARKILLRPYLQ